MTQTVPEGWYPNPENPAQQRYWDGSAWTQHVAPTAAGATDALQPTADAPVLQAWKTSVGFSILGLLVGFPLLVTVGTLLAIPLMALVDYLTGDQSLFPSLSAMVGNILMFVYALKFCPSYFTDAPRLRSSRAISFANFTFGGLIFGWLWNRNLGCRTKGSSYVVAAVLSGLMWVPAALGLLITLIFGGLLAAAS